MRDETLIKALEMHDRAINNLMTEFRAMQKVVDKSYVANLTHMMMWDVLFTLLEAKGIFTKEQFDAALKDLSDKTKAAMEEKAKQKTEALLTDPPAIPVVE